MTLLFFQAFDFMASNEGYEASIFATALFDGLIGGGLGRYFNAFLISQLHTRAMVPLFCLQNDFITSLWMD
ncbi:hypothetical protein [Bacillus piscicola]|uniref:hypothetical protein n=1 Tax=Bacillus piscicola TaxID=1632684 RepID=UPI001F091FA8|nr:hypothetical protein [Bacillus piscicola]